MSRHPGKPTDEEQDSAAEAFYDAAQFHGMELCVCGHAWGVHARPGHIDADVDTGERWCYQDDCRCRNYVASPSPAGGQK